MAVVYICILVGNFEPESLFVPVVRKFQNCEAIPGHCAPRVFRLESGLSLGRGARDPERGNRPVNNTAYFERPPPPGPVCEHATCTEDFLGSSYLLVNKRRTVVLNVDHGGRLTLMGS